MFGRSSDQELRLVTGDELRLRYVGDGLRQPWESTGNVMNISNNEEIMMELRHGELEHKFRSL